MSDSSKFKLPPELIKQLTRRSDARGLAQLGAHLALLLLAGIALRESLDSIGLIFTLPIYAAVLIFLFAPLHETIHYTVFKTRWLNNLVAAPIGFFTIAAVSEFSRVSLRASPPYTKPREGS